MILKRILIICLTFIFSFTLTGKEKIISSNIKSIQNKTIETIKHLAVQSTEDIENPDEIFNNAIEEYKEEFNDYLNITGLNVQDKEAINLSNFDINYIAPEFYDIMHDYQITLESSLTPLQLEKYDLLRKQDYNFDRYVTLNEIKFTNLNPSLKYDHTIKPTNPLIPITPLYPTFSDFENEKDKRYINNHK